MKNLHNLLVSTTVFLGLIFCTIHGYSQALEQDCINAIPVCQNIYVQNNSYVGGGTDEDEIDSDLSCLKAGEKNDVWYIFTVQQGGNLCFTITPSDPNDDYDWGVYNITNANCSDIRDGNIEVGCNFSANIGCSGTTGPNNENVLPWPCPEQNGPCIPVVAGQTYVVNVSNFSSSQSGYTLDFSASTAVIFDNIPPEIATVTSNCTDIQVEFSENVRCNTVTADDFVFTGPNNTPYQIVAISSENCDAGGSFESTFNLTVSPADFEPGTYTLELVGEVLDNCDNVALLSSQEVLIDFPEATFTVPESICLDQAATFTYTGNAGPTATFEWDIDGGTSVDGLPITGPGPHIIQWDTEGTKSVSLRVLENACRTDTVFKEINVFSLPIASIAPLDPQCLRGNVFNFSYDGPSDVLNYSWDFGDNNSTNLANPEHSYLLEGSKIVVLEITDPNQCVSQDTINVVVYENPEAAFATENICQNDTLIIENLSSAPKNTTITSYSWKFGNGLRSTEETPLPQFTRPGDFDIELIVGSDDGCYDTTQQTISVHVLPKASFSTTDVCTQDTAFFTNLSTISEGLLDSWSWNLGDGSIVDNQESPDHIYSQAGKYSVELIAISDKGCMASFADEIEIYSLPEAPTVEDQNVCFGDPAALSALPPNGSLVEWFDEPQSITPFTVGPLYLTPPVTFGQTFYVESVSDEGCRSERVNLQLGLYSEGQGEIGRIDSVLEIPSAIARLELEGSIDGDRYFWDFGDGTTSTAADAVHEYEHPGLYQINLMVIDINGCEYELSSEIEVKKIVFVHVPSAFTPNGDGMNDEFFVTHKLIQQFQLQIYTRTGRKVFETANPDFRWNGTSQNGEFLQEGVYVYVVRTVDVSGLKEEKAGTITLLR